MTRPLRSVLIGDVDFYPSEYAFGVNQAMTRAGHWHSSVNIRWDMGVIAKRVNEVQPDVIWGHMLLWAPRGADGRSITSDLLALCGAWRSRGTRVLLHDGDARTETRFPTDISPAVDLALCNHTADRSAWKIPQLHWPYFAFDQERMADPVPEFQCDLAFAGRLDDRPIYAERTKMVLDLKARLGDRMAIFPGGDAHTLFRTPELAVSAQAVLGYGRPESPGWIDVRAFQYPGAGGVLLYDDVHTLCKYDPELRNDWLLRVYRSGDASDIMAALDVLRGCDAADMQRFRERAFRYFQRKHSATARVGQALAVVGRTL